MRLSLLSFVILLAACGKTDPVPSVPAAPQVGPKQILSWTGFGPVTFGSKLEVVEQTLGPPAHSDRALDPGCATVTFPTIPAVQFMVEQGIVTRADVGAEVENILGVWVGAQFDAVKTAHPGARILPHKYDPSGHYVVFQASDGSRAIVLEETAGAITSIRAGLEPSVEYVERCL